MFGDLPTYMQGHEKLLTRVRRSIFVTVWCEDSVTLTTASCKSKKKTKKQRKVVMWWFGLCEVKGLQVRKNWTLRHGRSLATMLPFSWSKILYSTAMALPRWVQVLFVRVISRVCVLQTLCACRRLVSQLRVWRKFIGNCCKVKLTFTSQVYERTCWWATMFDEIAQKINLQERYKYKHVNQKCFFFNLKARLYSGQRK